MITSEQSINMFNTINKYLGNGSDALSLVNGIKDIAREIVSTELSKQMALVATKEDVHNQFALLATKEDVRNQVALLATKEDFHKMEVKMEKGFTDMMKWLIVLMIGFMSLLIAINKLSLP